MKQKAYDLKNCNLSEEEQAKLIELDLKRSELIIEHDYFTYKTEQLFSQLNFVEERISKLFDIMEQENE